MTSLKPQASWRLQVASLCMRFSWGLREDILGLWSTVNQTRRKCRWGTDYSHISFYWVISLTMTIPIMILIPNQSTRNDGNRENGWEWNSCKKFFSSQPWEWLSERTSERSEAREPTNLSGAREQSEQCRAIKWVKVVSKRASEWPSIYIPIECPLYPITLDQGPTVWKCNNLCLLLTGRITLSP